MSLTVTILDIIHRHLFYLKHSISEIGSCLRIQVQQTQLAPVDRSSLCVKRQTSSVYWAQQNVLHLETETESSIQKVVFSIKDRTMDNVQNCDSYINTPSPQTCR
jgi:hypothetical protein